MATTFPKASKSADDSEHDLESPRGGKIRQPRPEKLKGRGRLFPAQATGIEYPVEFGINSAPSAPQYGRVAQTTRWAKCSIRPIHGGVFPDGTYFLHTDEGRVHQLKVIGGVWHCLALAA
jgi:hypothetical protein